MTDVEENVEFRRLGRGGGTGLLVTLAIHGALALVVYQSQIRSAPRPEAVRDVITTRMIKLTKPREKPWLPRIVTPPKPEAPPPEIKLTENPEAPPAPPEKEAPKPEDKKINKDLKRALERARALSQAATEELDEGPVGGSVEGTSTENVAGDDYAASVQNAIHKNWNAPTGLLSDAQIAALVADVRISIDAGGNVKNPSLTKSSGNDLFDDSCMQAVRATGRVPPPPVNERAKYRKGVIIGCEGKELAR